MRFELELKIIDDSDNRSTFTTINPNGNKSVIKFDHMHMNQDREIFKDTQFASMHIKYKPGRLRMMIKMWQGKEGVKYDDLKVLDPLEAVES